MAFLIATIRFCTINKIFEKKLVYLKINCKNVQLRKKRKGLFNKTSLSLKNDADAILKTTVCLDQLVIIHVGYYVHDGNFQLVCGIVGLLIALFLSDSPDLVCEGDQIRRGRRPHVKD